MLEKESGRQQFRIDVIKMFKIFLETLPVQKAFLWFLSTTSLLLYLHCTLGSLAEIEILSMSEVQTLVLSKCLSDVHYVQPNLITLDLLRNKHGSYSMWSFLYPFIWEKEGQKVKMTLRWHSYIIADPDMESTPFRRGLFCFLTFRTSWVAGQLVKRPFRWVSGLFMWAVLSKECLGTGMSGRNPL